MADESTKPPKVFISYAWEDDVKSWVKALAKQLRKDGVDAVLDQWQTHYGDQLPEFMEKAVRESNFVIVVCTPVYKEKSDKRVGGVGYEGHIITSEILQNSTHRKFIPVLRKGSWGSALPSWAAGKLSIDLSGDPYSKKNYQELLRVLHGKWYTPPPIGKPPDFPDEEDDDVSPIAPRKPLVSKDDVDKFIVSLGNFGRKLIPLLRVVGILIMVGALFWAGSWAVPKFIALVPTSQATTTATQRPVAKVTSTKTPVPPTKTIRTNATPTKTRTPAPTSLPAEITDAKGASMVLVPAGKFVMGSDMDAYYLDIDQQPAHEVFLDSFYFDQYEVTNGIYKACVDAGVCIKPNSRSSNNRPQYYGNSEFDNYPVIYVDWNQAKAYCEWRGARLPTEAEWEKAARGTDERYYPWGDLGPGLEGTKANNTYNTVFTGDTTEVGSFPSGKSIYGAYDMAGNVWEWVNDWYQSDYYATLGDNAINPQGPAKGDSKVLRGGAWTPARPIGGAYIDGDISTFNRFRDFPSRFYYDTGFRCAKNATP